MTTTDKLLPCPFCGAVPDGIRCSGGDGFNFAVVSCQTKGCRSNSDGWCDEPNTSQAIAAWNRRASQATPAPSDALREAAIAVEQWWLTEGMYAFNGAPNAMFRLRAALTPAPVQEGEPRHD